MTYFPDLAPCTYHAEFRPSGVDLRAVGWLDRWHRYSRGAAPCGFVEALAHLCLRHPTARMRGWHGCELPHPTGRVDYPVTLTIAGQLTTLGDCELRVVTRDGQWLAAPSLVLHYVRDHGYLPPQAFVDAVLAHRDCGCQDLYPTVTDGRPPWSSR